VSAPIPDHLRAAAKLAALAVDALRCAIVAGFHPSVERDVRDEVHRILTNLAIEVEAAQLTERVTRIWRITYEVGDNRASVTDLEAYATYLRELAGEQTTALPVEDKPLHLRRCSACGVGRVLRGPEVGSPDNRATLLAYSCACAGPPPEGPGWAPVEASGGAGV
jgi:hypothetical protein